MSALPYALRSARKAIYAMGTDPPDPPDGGGDGRVTAAGTTVPDCGSAHGHDKTPASRAGAAPTGGAGAGTLAAPAGGAASPPVRHTTQNEGGVFTPSFPNSDQQSSLDAAVRLTSNDCVDTSRDSTSGLDHAGVPQDQVMTIAPLVGLDQVAKTDQSSNDMGGVLGAPPTTTAAAATSTGAAAATPFATTMDDELVPADSDDESSPKLVDSDPESEPEHDEGEPDSLPLVSEAEKVMYITPAVINFRLLLGFALRELDEPVRSVIILGHADPARFRDDLIVDKIGSVVYCSLLPSQRLRECFEAVAEREVALAFQELRSDATRASTDPLYEPFVEAPSPAPFALPGKPLAEPLPTAVPKPPPAPLPAHGSGVREGSAAGEAAARRALDSHPYLAPLKRASTLKPAEATAKAKNSLASRQLQRAKLEAAVKPSAPGLSARDVQYLGHAVGADGVHLADAAYGFEQGSLDPLAAARVKGYMRAPPDAPVKSEPADMPEPAASGARALSLDDAVMKRLDSLSNAVNALAKHAAAAAAVPVDDGSTTSGTQHSDGDASKHGGAPKPPSKGGLGGAPGSGPPDGSGSRGGGSSPRRPSAPPSDDGEPRRPLGLTVRESLHYTEPPLWWIMPGIECARPDTVELLEWEEAVVRHSPASAAQCKLFHKRSDQTITKFVDIFTTAATNVAMYSHNRTSLVESWARTYLATIFMQLMDGASISGAVLMEADYAVHSQVEAGLREASRSSPTLNRLLVAINSASSTPARRLRQLLRSLDSMCLHHKAADAVHGEFYALAPKQGDTPLSFFDHCVTEGGIRGFVDRDVISLFNSVLKRMGDDMSDLTDLLDSSDAPSTDVASLRGRLVRLNKANRPFKISGGRRGASHGDDSMMVVEVIADADARSTNPMASTQGSAYINTEDDNSAATVKSAVEAVKEVSVALRANTKMANALSAQLQAAPAQPTHAAGTLPGIDSAFWAGGDRPIFDLPVVYPKIFPGKPIPKQGELVGAECVACACDRPHITNWVKWEEHEEWHPKPGGAKSSGLPQGYGWMHNPGKCRCLEKRVKQHVAANPQDAYLLTATITPNRRA